MRPSKKEEFLNIFGISLALVACSAMIYMARVPSITGNVVLSQETTDIAIITILILAGLTLVLGAIVIVHKLKKEMEAHKKAIVQQPTGNLDIAEYISKARNKGFTDSQILSKLKSLGWKGKELKKYF